MTEITMTETGKIWIFDSWNLEFICYLGFGACDLISEMEWF